MISTITDDDNSGSWLPIEERRRRAA